MEIILKYFTNLDNKQKEQIASLFTHYSDWNEKINLISRKDFDFFYERHVLHSLALAKVFKPQPKTKFLDIGTGGGFPGIPLAILYPNCHFHLIDKIGKKIFAVEHIAKSLNLDNVLAEKKSAEELQSTYDFILARAVTKTETILDWSRKLVEKESKNSIPNGWFLWKGGDLQEEMRTIKNYEIHNLSDFFSDEFFETKKIFEIRNEL